MLWMLLVCQVIQKRGLMNRTPGECRVLVVIFFPFTGFLFHEIHSGGQSTQNFLKTLFAVERNDLNISLIDVILIIDD